MAYIATFQTCMKHKWGGGVLILLRLMGVTTLLDSLRRYLNGKWFILWCQTRISLLSCPKSSSVDHGFSMSSLVISSSTKNISTSSKLLVNWYGLSVRVRSSSPASGLLSWPKFRVFQVSPQGFSLMRSYIVVSLV